MLKWNIMKKIISLTQILFNVLKKSEGFEFPYNAMFVFVSSCIVCFYSSF